MSFTGDDELQKPQMETDDIALEVETEANEGKDIDESVSEFSYIENSEEIEKGEMENIKIPEEKAKMSTIAKPKVLSADHPLMVKYQKDLKERLQKLLLETDEKVIDMQRTVWAQEKENKHFAEKGYEMQKELNKQEDKLKSINERCIEKVQEKEEFQNKLNELEERFLSIKNSHADETKKDLELQTKLEDVAFEVVQLTSLQEETFTDTKSLKRAVEKSTKDRQNLEVEKLRQDIVLARLENDKFRFEDKINFYKTQWSIKKEEANDLRKELYAANSEMETIHYEKQQIVHQWKQSLASLSKVDIMLAGIRDSVREWEDKATTLNLDITSCKKSIRKELERNEKLSLQLHFRETDIARAEKELRDCTNRENDLEQNISVLEKTVEIADQELKILQDRKLLKEKDLDTKNREIQKVYTEQKKLEQEHMDMIHEKITVTKATKYTQKLIKDVMNQTEENVDRGSRKELEKERLHLKLDNMRIHFKNMEDAMKMMQKESKEKEDILNQSEESVLKNREKLDVKRAEIRAHENELKEIIERAGGQELAPFERELSGLKKEISVAELGKRHQEQEYLHCQKELFTITKQSSIKSEENDFNHKKFAVLEGKKMQLEADITKEEKEIKDILNRIQRIRNEIAHVNTILYERNEVEDNLLTTVALYKCDLTKILKEAEMTYIQRQNELRILKKEKRKHFQKLVEAQMHIVFWDGKVHLVEETRKVLKSDMQLKEFSDLRIEIRRLQMRLDQIRKEEHTLSLEMERAVYRHTSLYIEADKRSMLTGKSTKSSDYVLKKIKYSQKKIQSEKKELENMIKEIEDLEAQELELTEAQKLEKENSKDIIKTIKSMENEIDAKKQEKRLDILKLSFKQKKTKYMQKILDGTYIRAVRNEARRLNEIEKLQSQLHALRVITQATINEHPYLGKHLNKIMDYIAVSKLL